MPNSLIVGMLPGDVVTPLPGFCVSLFSRWFTNTHDVDYSNYYVQCKVEIGRAHV